MQHKIKLTSMALLLCLVYAAFVFISCGGSSGGDTGISSTGGNVAFFLTDGPADEYDHIWAGVKAVFLIPADDGNPVPIFQSPYPDGKEVDLLDLKDQKFLLSVKKDVPIGFYSKIRLIIAYIHPEGGTGPCADEDLEIKLPSGKIDLNPRENFEVVSGETLAISLDMDMDKSIKLKPAGNSGKCIFRPVIFVDIETVITPEHCPRVLSGEIDELILDDEKNVTGFVLDLKEGRGMLDVFLTNETVIFDQNGLSGDRDDLDEGQIVQVRGRLNPEGDFEASVIVIGGVEKFKGTVTDSAPDDFTLKLDNEAGTLIVDLTEDTIIFIGCDQPYEGIIPVGWTARVFGKFEVIDSQNAFRAVVVFLQQEQPSGLLTDITRADTEDGYNLTIKTDETTTLNVFLPDGALVKLKGDGDIDIDRLSDWVECQGGREVEVVLDPTVTDPPTAKKLIVLPDEISATVTLKDFNNLILYTTEGYIAVEEDATIFRVKNDQQKLIEFEDIQIGEEFVAYGIKACLYDSFADFYAFVIQLGD
jgi:hypothetical protein